MKKHYLLRICPHPLIPNPRPRNGLGLQRRKMPFLLPGWCFPVIFLLFPYTQVAQIRCLANQAEGKNALRFPELISQRVQLQAKMDQALLQPDALSRAVVTIPVVVHVVYKEPFENISDEQIFSQMAVLNEDFRRLNSNAGSVPPPFAPFAADMEMEFCLAGHDPAGQPTSGITRRQTTWSNIGDLPAPDGRPRINYAELGGEDAWDSERYLNIWLGTIGGGALGMGTFPGTAPPEEDGVVIDPRYFGTTGLAASSAPHHLGRTATHEIGHFFNLKHIWGGDTNICDDDDEVADTPVQRSAYLGCPAFPQMSCGNSAMFMNFMDYTDDVCVSLFTLGQKARVWAALNIARPGLVGTVVCNTTMVGDLVAKSSFRLAPNPAKDMLWIDFEEITSVPAQISVSDITGKVWMTQWTEKNAATPVQLDVSTLPAGYYMVSVLKARIFASQCFVKSP